MNRPGLEDLDFDTLRMLRARATTREQQNLLAPYEHQQFTRELTGTNPLWAASLAPAIPAYQLYKLLFDKGRSAPQMESMKRAYMGIGQGLRDWYTK